MKKDNGRQPINANRDIEGRLPVIQTGVKFHTPTIAATATTVIRQQQKQQ